MTPWVGAAAWLAAYGVLVLAPVFALLLEPRPLGLGFWWDFAMGLGFAGTTMMAVQFVLTARFRRATAPYGIDIIYYFHRSLAGVAFVLVVAHPAILVIEMPAVLTYLNPLAAPWHMQAGLASLVALTLLMVTSLARRALRIEYDAWRRLHMVLAVVAVGGALAHMEGVGYYVAMPAPRVLWAVITVSLVGIVLYVRGLRPARLRRRPYTVTRVTPERGDAWTLALAPVGHDGLRFAPGQFVWLTIGFSPFAMREHPFSVSSSPRTDGSLELTIKELGDFTSTVGRIAPGTTAYVDGPYGAFSIDRHQASGYVFLAGGIGIAPIVSMLRALADRDDRRPVMLFYAYRRWDRMTFREALDELRGRLSLTVVYVLEEPPEDWTGETGRITTALLERHLPATRASFEYFICGPVPMISAVERSLHEAGVPLARLRSELFDLA